VIAEQAVYQCGQELTNLPKNLELCQKLETSNLVQIEGTKVQISPKLDSTPKAKDIAIEGMPVVQTNTQELHQRQAQARTILESERQNLIKQHAELVRIYKQGQPDLLDGESRNQAQYQHRVATLKTNVFRLERDLQALHRELARYAAPVASGQLK
jgi:hypothetical protein